MAKNKIHTVTVRIERDVTRQVSATTENKAIRKLKEALVIKGIKLSKKDFNKNCDNAYERY